MQLITRHVRKFCCKAIEQLSSPVQILGRIIQISTARLVSRNKAGRPPVLLVDILKEYRRPIQAPPNDFEDTRQVFGRDFQLASVVTGKRDLEVDTGIQGWHLFIGGRWP
jgi:hypothetical protein